MQLLLYPRLSTCSRRSLLRRRKKFGHAYDYRPRRRLILRLAYEMGWTESQVREQLLKERAYLIAQTF